MNNQENPSKGFITVATRRKQFLIAAVNLCESILDHYPDAKVTLFTDQVFVDTENLSMFDKVIVPPSDEAKNATAGPREKMWAMANTPYDQTLYLDADIEIVHDDIEHVFDRLNPDLDMCFVELTRESSKHFTMWEWGTGSLDHLTHCGGVCLYRSSNPLVREFMLDWYQIHLDMRFGIVVPEECKYVPKKFLVWDQLTLWYLIWHHKKYKNLKWKFFEDNYRWNYYSSFGFNFDGTYNYDVVDPVIIHYSSWMDKGQKGIL